MDTLEENMNFIKKNFEEIQIFIILENFRNSIYTGKIYFFKSTVV